MSSGIGTGHLWSGRFADKPHPVFEKFNRSFGFDSRLVQADIRGSLAHLQALLGAGVVTDAEGLKLQCALEELSTSLTHKTISLTDFNSEDVHSFLEGYLTEKLGDLGKKIHTGRSRNDQVATALRIWLADEIESLSRELGAFLSSLLRLAHENIEAAFPAYTHLQRAQPILFSHWVLAHFEAFNRDFKRLQNTLGSTQMLPLGSGACAGNGFGLNRSTSAQQLGWNSLSLNSLDAVSDRDFAVEFHSFAALAGVHLSRWAEDLVIYSSYEFGLIEFGDSVSSGSSLLPQKKNPDAAELIRGKSGRLIGHLVQSLVLLKGLPSCYNKDLQEDKESLFDSVDTLHACFEMAAVLTQNLKLNVAKADQAARDPSLAAVDLADFLVRSGVPFRDAHTQVGRLVREAHSQGQNLPDLSDSEIQRICPKLDQTALRSAIQLESALGHKCSTGGTAPSSVKAALADAQLRLEKGLAALS